MTKNDLNELRNLPVGGSKRFELACGNTLEIFRPHFDGIYVSSEDRLHFANSGNDMDQIGDRTPHCALRFYVDNDALPGLAHIMKTIAQALKEGKW